MHILKNSIPTRQSAPIIVGGGNSSNKIVRANAVVRHSLYASAVIGDQCSSGSMRATTELERTTKLV